MAANEGQDSLPALTRPAIALEPQPDSKSLSQFGGSPLVPPNFEWPRYKDKPLDFLLQIELTEIGKLDAGLDLPDTGRLLFFYDTEDQKWGFDPADRGCSRVVWIDDRGDNKKMPPPGKQHPLPEVRIAFSGKTTLPDPFSERIDAFNLTDAQKKILSGFRPDGPPSYTQIGGFPYAIQDDMMEPQSEAVSHGIYAGDGSWIKSMDAVSAASARQTWQLLLQLPSMEDYGTMWGDSGNLYFWIRQDDLARRDFSKVWLILQCY